MRPCSPELTARLAEKTTTLARLWRVQRKDGLFLRFTDAVRPIVVPGDGTYRSDISFTCSAIFTSRSAVNLQTVTITVAMDPLGINEADLRARLFDLAYAEVMVVDYKYPQYGTLTIFTGNFTNVKITDKKRATIDIQPTGQLSAGTVLGGDVYQGTCRASLGVGTGRNPCPVNIDARKMSFVVSLATGGSITSPAFTQESTHWALGFIVWTSGANKGSKSTVGSADQASNSVFLTSAPLNAVQVGDTGLIYPGCDKIITTCRDKFAVAPYFQGEPAVPDGSGTSGSFSELRTTY